jgi:hypothetical protein
MTLSRCRIDGSTPAGCLMSETKEPPQTEAGRRALRNIVDWAGWQNDADIDLTITPLIVAIEREALAAPVAALDALREAFAAEFPVGPPLYGHDEMCAAVRYPGNYDEPPDPCTCRHDAIERLRHLLDPTSDPLATPK